MALSERDRARYARHLLLSQLGEAGQERLLAAELHAPTDADRGALEVARTYLTRAGAAVSVELALDDAVGPMLDVPSSAALAQIAGSFELLPAARALCGALSAVQAIKRVTGLTESHSQSQIFAISSEDA